MNGAELLVWQNQIGPIKIGCLGDIIAAPGNPLADISVPTKAALVMKRRLIYKRP